MALSTIGCVCVLFFLGTLFLSSCHAQNTIPFPPGGKNNDTKLQYCAPKTCIPSNIHFSILQQDTMAISWMTTQYSNTSTVNYGTESGNLNFSLTGNSSSYQQSESDRGQNVVFFHHTVILPNLSPSEQYFYQCGDAYGGWSPVYSFSTPPNSYVPTTVAIYGDLGISNGQMTSSRLNALAPLNDSFDFVFHVGDMSYADDFNAASYEEVWNAWFTVMQPVMTIKPYMVGPGNHEFSCQHEDCDYNTENFTDFRYRFRMPYVESGAINNMWWSFNYSNIHFIMMDTETDFPDAPEGTEMFGDQLEWLENDLIRANQNREQYPWLIVGGHRPIYSSQVGFCDNYTGDPIGDPANLQRAVEELFYRYYVDIFIVGHVHAYERCYPTYQNTRTSTSYDNPPSTVYITIGSAGNTEGLSQNWVSPVPSWSATVYDKSYGYGLMNIYDDDYTKQHVANWTFFRSKDNGVQDNVVITKNYSGY